MQRDVDRVMRVVSRQDGFTLIELLVAMLVSMVIFSATMYVLEGYLRATQRTTTRNDAQDQVRLAVDRIVRQLRNVSSPQAGPALFERATPYDIVFQTVGTPNGANVAGIQRVRYCIPPDTAQGDPAAEVMFSQTQTWSTAAPPANPWPQNSASIACPDASTPSAVHVAGGVTNRLQTAARPDPPAAFTYNGAPDPPSDLSTITSVQLDLLINTDTKLQAAESEVRSTVFARNQNRPPSASFSYAAAGSGTVVLNGGSSYDPDGQDLTYTWSCTSASCPSPSTLTSAGTGLVQWSPGPGTYTVTLTVTDPSGLPATATQTVVVT
jgi:prepilin-type N-terminal cleavage/methylation domain-containing protein